MWVLTTDVGATVPSDFILRAGTSMPDMFSWRLSEIDANWLSRPCILSPGEHAIGRTAAKPEGVESDGWIRCTYSVFASVK